MYALANQIYYQNKPNWCDCFDNNFSLIGFLVQVLIFFTSENIAKIFFAIFSFSKLMKQKSRYVY